MQCHPQGDTITFMITYKKAQLKANLQFSEPYEKHWILKNFKVNEFKMKASYISIKAIETTLLSLKQEYNIGTKTISDLLTEEEKLLNIKLNLYNAKKDYLIAYFKIKSLEGLLLDSFEGYLPNIN